MTQGKHRAGSFSSLTPAMPLSQQNVSKMQGLLVSKADSADVESGLKSRHVHCMSPGRTSGYKNAIDALEGHAEVKTASAYPMLSHSSLMCPLAPSIYKHTQVCRLN